MASSPPTAARLALFAGCLGLTAASCTLDRSGTAGAGGGGNSGGQGGEATACDSVAQCPESTECASYECAEGRCKVTFVPDGTPVVAGQTESDCKVIACDGAGSVVTLNDDDDAPDDPNPCTTDSCSDGTPVHDPVADGTECGQGLQCKAGVCSGCTQDAQCPVGDQCRTATCDMPSGDCGFVVETGKVIPPDDPTDCVQDQCNDQGNVETVGDATEVPPDADPCLVEGCSSAGDVTNTPEVDGTSCPGGNYCYGGACVQCGIPAECGTPAICKQYECNANACVLVDAPDGPLPDPDPDDCVVPGCTGGSPSPTTLPDGDSCTGPMGASVCCSGSCCNGPGTGCTAGACCPTARSCNGNTVCCMGMDMECCADGATCGMTGC